MIINYVYHGQEVRWSCGAIYVPDECVRVRVCARACVYVFAVYVSVCVRVCVWGGVHTCVRACM